MKVGGGDSRSGYFVFFEVGSFYGVFELVVIYFFEDCRRGVYMVFGERGWVMLLVLFCCWKFCDGSICGVCSFMIIVGGFVLIL